MDNNDEETMKLEPEEVEVTAEEVKEFMDAEAGAGETVAEERNAAPSARLEPGREMADELAGKAGARVEGNVDKGNMRISLGGDSTFNRNSRADAAFDNLSVNVRAEDIAITTQDKVAYIKSVLMDSDAELEVELAGGRVKAVYRSLSAYEQDLLTAALSLYVSEHPTAGFMLLQVMKQHFMIAMELVRFNGKPIDNLRYSNSNGRSLEENARDLLERSGKLLDTTGPRFAFYVAGADVFHNKMTKLGEAALNKDFFDPAFADL